MRIYEPSLNALLSNPRGVEDHPEARRSGDGGPSTVPLAERGAPDKPHRSPRLALPVAAASALVALAAWLRSRPIQH